MASITVNPHLEDRPMAVCNALGDGTAWVYVKYGNDVTVHLPDEDRRCLEYGRELVAALSTALDMLEARLAVPASGKFYDGTPSIES